MAKTHSKTETLQVELVEEELAEVSAGASGVPGISYGNYAFKIDNAPTYKKVAGGGVPGASFDRYTFKV